MEEFAIERVTRDARINRIFEGTNEINRLLLAGTLFKRATQQRLPLLPAAMSVEKTLSAGEEPAFEPSSDWLEDLQRDVERMKCAAVFAADSAVTRTLQHGAEGQQPELFADLSAVYTVQARDRTLGLARSVLSASLEGVELDRAIERLSVVDRWRPFDLHGARDRVAEAVVDAEGWPL